MTDLICEEIMSAVGYAEDCSRVCTGVLVQVHHLFDHCPVVGGHGCTGEQKDQNKFDHKCNVLRR